MIDRSLSVAEIACDVPGAPLVFEEAGIDYCCAGSRSLADACTNAGVPVERVVADLEKGTTRGLPADRRWNDGTVEELLDFIESTHHEYTRREMERLDALMDKVGHAHGEAHPELAEVARLYAALEEDIRPHLLKEEEVLFPMIRAKQPAIEGPVEVMLVDHDAVGEILRELRAATNGYTVPADGCGSWRALFDGLRALEADLHRHIHLENNVLFPRLGIELPAD
ncbi:MAG TPA: iron-sulfur cluster repair di-iron protein [Polyangiaceae bacterium]|nr:iron-sulfur cluster repair di-iron protein [Polyangiaceae bacterium]